MKNLEEIYENVIAEASVMEYVALRIEKYLDSFKRIKYTKESKIGYDKFIMGDYSIISDGVGIAVKKKDKEIAYFDRPKLNYKKAVDQIADLV